MLLLQKLLICRSWMPLQERRSKASMMASPLAARQQLRHQQWVPQLITATGSVRSRQVPQVPLHPGAVPVSVSWGARPRPM